MFNNQTTYTPEQLLQFQIQNLPPGTVIHAMPGQQHPPTSAQLQHLYANPMPAPTGNHNPIYFNQFLAQHQNTTPAQGNAYMQVPIDIQQNYEALRENYEAIGRLQALTLQHQQAVDATNMHDDDLPTRMERYQQAYSNILAQQAAIAAQVGGVPANLTSQQLTFLATITPPPTPLPSQHISPFLQPPIPQTQPMNTSADMDTSGSQVSIGSKAPASISSKQSQINTVYNTSLKNITKIDVQSVAADSALGSGSNSGSISPDNENRQYQSSKLKTTQYGMVSTSQQQQGILASAASLTPALLVTPNNQFPFLANNPQVHVPCTAKCYHKCKLGLGCPRHAHKHLERIERKRQQALAKEQASVSGSTAGSTCSVKSVETSSCVSASSSAFSQLEKKSGKNDGKKRTFLDLYEVYNVIGVGGGGMVYSGRRISDKLPVAIKRVMREKVKRWEQVQGYQVPQEIALMLRCYGHPGVIKLVDWYECLDSFILIMERPERAVDLFDYIRELGRIPEREAAKIFKQVLDAAIHIQNMGVVHRDIKDENIIINRDTNEAKLIDFGCGTLLKDSAYRDFSGTPEFYPPEWFRDREYYARTAAVWSLGVLLFDMLQGEIPFKQKEKIVENKPNYKHSMSVEGKHLVQWCMSTVAHERPTLEEISRHPWIINGLL